MCAEIYGITNLGGFTRDFALRDQIRRAAVSVSSNIAEGFESRTRGLFLDYLGRAKGSAGEVRSQLYVALDVKYIDEDAFDALCDRVRHCSAQLHNLMESLRVR